MPPLSALAAHGPEQISVSVAAPGQPPRRWRVSQDVHTTGVIGFALQAIDAGRFICFSSPRRLPESFSMDEVDGRPGDLAFQAGQLSAPAGAPTLFLSPGRDFPYLCPPESRMGPHLTHRNENRRSSPQKIVILGEVQRSQRICFCSPVPRLPARPCRRPVSRFPLQLIGFVSASRCSGSPRDFYPLKSTSQQKEKTDENVSGK